MFSDRPGDSLGEVSFTDEHGKRRIRFDGDGQKEWISARVDGLIDAPDFDRSL